MGRKSAKEKGKSIFGMRARKVELRAGVTLPEILEVSTILTRRGPKRSKKVKKNSTGHPSGLGALSFLKSFKGISTSKIVTGLAKAVIFSELIKEGKRRITLS